MTDEYKYMDYPDEGWMASPWDWSHTIGCGVATFLYVIPGAIFLLWKGIARMSYTSAYDIAKKNNEQAFQRTGCHYLAPVTHLGGHPYLPYNEKILMGISADKLHFFSYDLKELHSISIKEINTTQTSNALPVTQAVNSIPDSLKLRIPVSGVMCETELGLSAGSIRFFWQVFNETLVNLKNKG